MSLVEFSTPSILGIAARPRQSRNPTDQAVSAATDQAEWLISIRQIAELLSTLPVINVENEEVLKLQRMN